MLRDSLLGLEKENAVYLVIDDNRDEIVKSAIKQCEDFLNG